MKTETQPSVANVNMARRAFLRYAGAATAVAGLVAMQACNKEDDSIIDNNNGITDVGSGDIGILNYAYALEQLEAAFYIQVVNSFSGEFSADEKALLTDIRDHEVAHREFFKKALGSGAIKGLTPDFSKITFSSRASVLAAAKAFEDLGVTAYDGVGAQIKDVKYLAVAGKIVSVEARHASLIANILADGRYIGIDQIDGDGLNITHTPAEVLAVANTFLTTKVSAKSFTF